MGFPIARLRPTRGPRPRPPPPPPPLPRPPPSCFFLPRRGFIPTTQCGGTHHAMCAREPCRACSPSARRSSTSQRRCTRRLPAPALRAPPLLLRAPSARGAVHFRRRRVWERVGPAMCFASSRQQRKRACLAGVASRSLYRRDAAAGLADRGVVLPVCGMGGSRGCRLGSKLRFTQEWPGHELGQWCRHTPVALGLKWKSPSTWREDRQMSSGRSSHGGARFTSLRCAFHAV